MLQNIFKFFKIINYSEKIKLITFIPLTIILFFVEMVGLGFIIPLVSLLIDGDPFANFVNIKFFSYLSNIYNDAIINYSKYTLIKYLLVIYISIFIIKNLYVLFYNWTIFSFSNSIQQRVSSQLLQSYYRLNYLDFIDKNVSTFVNNTLSETTNLRNLIRNLIFLFSEIIIFVGISLLIFSYHLKASFFGILLILLTSLFYYLIFKKRLEKLGFDRNLLNRKMMKNLLQSLDGFKIIKILDKQNFFLKFHKITILKFLNNNKILSLLNILPRLWIEISSIISISIIVIIMLDENINSQSVIPFLSLLVVAMIRVIPSINKIILALQSLKSSKVTLDIILNDIANSKQRIFKNFETIKYDKKIELKNIFYKYGDRENPLFNKINLEIIKGNAYAIKGKSGSGKTTLLNIILGILKPQSGGIFVDNKELELNNPNWMAKIGFVTQETFLFDDTIINNVTMDFDNQNSSYDNDKVFKILKSLDLESFVKSLPKGLNTIVGEKGVKISGGQKQRLGIARALFSEPEILIFDEPTSSLDKENSNQIFKYLLSYKSKKTILVVSHNILFENEFDHILNMENGKIF